ncbi:hypothetical protein F383_33870 [Gossypium arboreum]|nr:hypothetical protein F383_33870 [Gossypium arboreum]
MGNSIRI